MGTLLVAYIVVAGHPLPSDTWPWVDGWGVCLYELILVGMLFSRAFSGRPGRAVPLVLGGAILAWALGDFLLTWETWGSPNPAPVPSIADAGYIAFYPLAYTAIVLMLRKE